MILVFFTPRALTGRVPFVLIPTSFTSNITLETHGNRFMSRTKRLEKLWNQFPVVSLVAAKSSPESVRSLRQLLPSWMAISLSTSARQSRNEPREAPSWVACVYLAHHPDDTPKLPRQSYGPQVLPAFVVILSLGTSQAWSEAAGLPSTAQGRPIKARWTLTRKGKCHLLSPRGLLSPGGLSIN